MQICLKVASAKKRITSQIISFEAQFQKFFYLVEKLCSNLEISSFCIFNHPMIYQICDAMMSTWDRVNFWIHLLNSNSLSHQTGAIDEYKQGQ